MSIVPRAWFIGQRAATEQRQRWGATLAAAARDIAAHCDCFDGGAEDQADGFAEVAEIAARNRT